MLFVGANRTVLESRSTGSSAYTPATVEALAVLIHLAAQNFDCDTCCVLGPCKDIKALYSKSYHKPKEFLPVAATVAGLFGLNVQIRARERMYRISNSHYGGHVGPGGSGIQGFILVGQGPIEHGHRSL